MPNRVRVLTVTDAERAELTRRVRAKGAPAREVERARIVLNERLLEVMREPARADGLLSALGLE